MERLTENAKCIWPNFISTFKSTARVFIWRRKAHRRRTCGYRFWQDYPPVREACSVDQNRREQALRRRKRSVSIDHSKRTAMKQQNQSRFFQRLPAEIRLQIYDEVLRGNATRRVHLQRWFHHKGIKPIPWESFNCKTEGSIVCENNTCLSQENFLDVFRPLSMLLTCKRIYREAINILYSKHHFIFECRKEFIYFTRALPTPRLSQIREVTIQGQIDFGLYDGLPHIGLQPPSTIKELDEALSTLPNLRKVFLIAGPRGRWVHDISWELFYEAGYKKNQFVKAQCEVWFWIDDERWWKSWYGAGDRPPLRELIRLK